MTRSDESLGPQPVGKGGGGTTGRADDQGNEDSSGGQVVSTYCSPRKAGVVIRASVEHIGVVGDTELTVNVKWPSSSFCIQPHGKPAAPPCQATDSQQVPGNGPEANNFDTLYGEASDPGPERGLVIPAQPIQVCPPPAPTVPESATPGAPAPPSSEPPPTPPEPPASPVPLKTRRSRKK